MTLLAHAEDAYLPSVIIAGSLRVNPVIVRKELMVLAQQGLVQSKQGKDGGSRLARSPEVITLGDIFNLVTDAHVFGFSKNEPNPLCAIGREINTHLDDLFTEIDARIEMNLRQITLAQFLRKFHQD